MVIDNISADLNTICSVFTSNLEMMTDKKPKGCCYLVGHCLSQGFNGYGLVAKEVSGNLILQDKNRKSIVYGKSIYKGKLVGYYHTWCTLDYNGETIIVDPSLKYLKLVLKGSGIKLNQNLPDCLISTEIKTWYYNYIEDSTLVPQSKSYLETVDNALIDYLVTSVKDTAQAIEFSIKY